MTSEAFFRQWKEMDRRDMDGRYGYVAKYGHTPKVVEVAQDTPMQSTGVVGS